MRSFLSSNLYDRTNLKKIEAHNEREEKGLETWRMAVTQFADLTEKVFAIFVIKAINNSISITFRLPYQSSQPTAL